MITKFMERLFPPAEKERNPYGETWEEFIGKYPSMEHIAMACWYLGVRPEEFADEVRELLEMGKNVEGSNSEGR